MADEKLDELANKVKEVVKMFKGREEEKKKEEDEEEKKE